MPRKKSAPKNKPTKTPKSLLLGMYIFIFGFSTGFGVKYLPSFSTVTEETSLYASHSKELHSKVSKNVMLPSVIPALERAGYTLAFDGRSKNALWVYEELTQETVKGDVDRGQFKFVQDPDIPSHIQADTSDYRGSGFDRGHLCPAGDCKSCSISMKETFFLSNISPQMPQFNRGYWKKLEKHVRDLTANYPIVRVVTGPLYLPYNESDGKRYVKYQVIGKNDVAVPTHFFKVITAGEAKNKKQWAYILPNESIGDAVSLETFRTTVEKIEHASGVLFAK